MDIFYASLIGISRTIAALPFEHPFEYIKTQVQANPHVDPYKFVINDIKSNGILKLYTGLIPNAIRNSFKQAYRFPMMVHFPRIFRTFIRNENAVQTLTGLSIAAIEGYIICPLERLKTWIMTSPKATIRQFFREKNLKHEAFRGIQPLLFKQTISWVTFLGCTSFFKEITKKYTHKEELLYSELLIIGAIVGVINTAAVMPLDFAKTQLQKYGEMEGKSTWGVLKKFIDNEKSNIGKIRIVCSGWQFRIVQYIIDACLTVSLLDRLDTHFKNRAKS
ncbi:unnamed protein product [Blepharisma stoltei]|uniref:Mitochondrial carrier protein n=1 Tax=Blepharisma stoltei TaxID=1481888 RepID=A0AAU9K4D7_9CILI|nr:unnamed protein product [Blepharisma stoltei]